MKNLIFKSSFHEKLKVLIIPMMLLTLGVGQMWAGHGYNGESHVYLNVNGTTKYYKVSTESWAIGGGISIPGTWGGVLKDQTFNNVLNIQVVGGAVGGWWENDNISGNLYYKVTNNTTTPSSGWTSVGNINATYTNKNGNNGFRYKNNYSVNVTPTTPGTYYLHIKITDGDSNNRTSYVKFTIPSYTVAGSSAVLGSEWSATDTNNDMVWSSGTTYILTKSNVTLTKGTTYEYKVALNHTWGTAYPGSNASIDFGNTTGHYDVTFSFNASTHAVSATATRLYAVSYNDNSSTSGSVPATTYHANGATVTVASNSGSLAKSGYSFGGWNTNSSGTGTNYTAGSGTFTMGSSDKELFAKWTENMSTVSFVADPSGKGTFQVGGATVTSTTAGVTTTRSVTAVAADGYHWTGWSITGGATISSSSTNPTTVTGGGAGTAATLTATFAADATNTLTVTATTGGSITTPAAGYYSDITTTGYSIAASRSEGYKFTGWTKTAGDGAVSFANASSLSTTATITTLGDVTVTAGFAAMSNSLSVSSSTLYAGDNITLTATRTNHSLNLTYQYKIGSGSWTDIATQSGTSKTWQIPYANTYQTYKFRVKSTDGSTDIISSEQTVNVKGRITIHVKNTNSWGSVYLYSWYSTSTTTNGAYPGKTGTGLNNQSSAIHATGSLWWDVTITQETATAQKFILNKGESGDANQTNDLNLSSYSHDGYYAIGTESGKKTLTTTTTPAAPALSTSAAGTIRETSAVLGGNVTNLGNDIISERGYYWSTNSALSSSNLGVGTKVTVSGTQSSTGTFSSTKSSLTAGTKYYFIAYAKNGYGTSYGAVNNFTTLSTYTVTVTASAGGSASPSTVTAGQYQLSGTITASANTGYFFNNWTKTSGSGTVTFTDANAASTTLKSTSTATVRANFASKWGLYSSINSWGDPTPLGNYSTSSSKDYGYVEVDLAANTQYSFKIRDFQTSANYKPSSNTEITYSNKATARTMSSTASGEPNQTIMTAGAGTYRFTWNITDKSIKMTYPTSYTVTFGKVASTGASIGSVSATGDDGASLTSGKYVAKGSATFTATDNITGYHFKEWRTSNTYGSGTLLSTSNPYTMSSISDNKTVYANYAANDYTVTLDVDEAHMGNISGATTSQTVYYKTATVTVPNRPTAEQGYGLDGYYTGQNGAGTKLINGDGTWIASVSGYTDANKKWIKTSGVTLYAYYKKAEITGLTFKNNNVVVSPPVFPADANKITVTANLEPTPAGSTHIDWRMLHGNDNPLDDQPSFGTGTTTNQFALPAGASGTYKIEAVLRMGATAGEGTTLSTMVVQFQVAAEHTVTVLYKCGDETIKSSSTVTGKPLEWTEVVAHKIVGYSFDSWTAGDGITLRDTTAARLAQLQAADPTIVAVKRMKAIYDGKLTINYTPKRMIYFYNTLNWSDVYVYFYKNDSYWGSSDQGSGANTSWQLTNYPYGEGKHGKMSPVEPGSKIYYFDADSAGVNASYTNVVFTELNQHGCDYFYNNNKVVRRGDYYATTMPLFVPLSDQPAVDKNGKTAKYYCEGYWMNYPANTGYTLRIYDTPGANNATGASREFLIPFSADIKMPLKQDVEINFSGESWFIIYRNDGKYLEGSHTFKQADHGDKKITSTDKAGTASKMRLISDGSGIYTFNLSFYGDDSSPVNYDYYLSVDFPAAVGDYRVVYKDNATWSNGAHGAQWYHPSDIISKNKSATDAKEDIVSFFISKGAGITPSMKFQRIKSISDASGSYGKITWEDVPSGDITIPSSITSAGVYNFIVSQPAGGASISLVRAEPYTGNYYIRTDCAGETKWNNFRAPDHLMSYSEYSITHGGYSHYYTHWVQTTDKKNIQFCIANDYSSAISDTLIRESNSVPGWENINTYINSDGDILRNANVRFMWNQSTNKVSRAYVDGAQGVGSNNFLYILSEDSKIRNADESPLVNNKVQFSDKENWIYEAYIQAKPNAAIKLLSNWGESNKITQYFKGSSSSTEKLIGGSGSDFNTIRVLYDFKTNRLIAALVPTSGNYESDNAIEADIMFIREHQGDVAQLTFGDAGKISKIETAYGVMRFNKWTMNNKSKEEGHSPLDNPASVYERSLFWISFPFKVKLSEVFGFGTYGEHWAVQRYDGADRAARGHFQENGSFWKWMNRSTEYLEPNQGYLLAIDADLLTEDGGMWPNNIQNLELFFPSYGKMPDITSADVSQTIPTHTCEIDWATTKGLPRTNDPRTSYDRTIFDSHWNVISVPTYVNTDDVTFANTTWTAAGKMGPKFLYTWNADDNTITATTASGYTYHAMHAYMTQYCGGITWSAKSGSPASVVARRAYMDEPKEIEFNLELQQNEKTIDRAFVVLSADEDVSAGFQFGEDMTKEFNASRSAIYTFIPDVAAVAGNTLPMSDQTTVVPVGVDIIAEGEYIISLPEGTSGVGVTLIDNELQTRTNLALTDYAVTLPAGTYDERFVIEISPIEPISTNVETVTGDGLQVNGVCKKLIDGVLYIVKDGKVFDARGARVQ